MREITYQQLVRANACADQLRLFKRLFGDAVVPTDALVQKHGHLFNADFAANAFLDEKQLEQYEKAEAPLLEQYEKATAPLWEQYKRGCVAVFVKLYQQG